MRYIPTLKEYNNSFDFILPFFTRMNDDFNKIFETTLENSDPNITYIDVTTSIFRLS